MSLPRMAGSSSRLFGLVLEPVAHAAQRLDVRAHVAQLLAQPLDVGIDRARRNVGLDAPDVTEQRVAGLHPATARQEGMEQTELERRQADLGVVDPRAVGVAIDLEPAEPDQRRLALDA